MIQFKKEIFDYYRENGFPDFPVDNSWRKNEFLKFINFDNSNIVFNDEIKQTMHGLAFCWSFMPHAYNVVCNGFKSPL
jgi:hypothetical protein